MTGAGKFSPHLSLTYFFTGMLWHSTGETVTALITPINRLMQLETRLYRVDLKIGPLATETQQMCHWTHTHHTAEYGLSFKILS